MIKIIKRLYYDLFNETKKTDYMKIIEQAYKAGYKYHQNMVRRDAKLLEWVLKKNYFEQDKID
jgi:hypothetical protein